MPFDRPIPNEILQRIQAEIDLAIPGADARLRNSVENVIARILSMASHELYGFLAWNSQQILPDSAEAEYLARHASIWGIERKAATKATGTVTFTGTNGLLVPTGHILKSVNDIEYTLDEEVTISGGTAIGSITASIAGSSGNADVGTKISLVSPIAGIQTEAIVNDDGTGNGLTGGADIEADKDLRSRVISRIQEPPHGGAEFDYKFWAKEIAGVTRVWVYPLQGGEGTVSLTFVMDNKTDTIIPSAGEVETVQDYIDEQRPVTADITVFAPTAVDLDFDISLTPNSTEVQEAIKAELQDLLEREAEPGGTLYLSRIQEAISTAAGEFDHVLNSPDANVVSDFGDIPVLGAFSWSVIT